MLPIPDSTLLLSVLHQRGSSRVEVQLHAAAPAFELVYLSAAVEIVHIGIQVVDVCLIADIFRHIGDQPVHHFTAVVHEFLDQTGIGAVVRTALELCNELRIADLLHTVRQAELRVDRGNVMQAIVEDAVLCLRLDDRNGCAFFCCRKSAHGTGIAAADDHDIRFNGIHDLAVRDLRSVTQPAGIFCSSFCSGHSVFHCPLPG